MGDGDTRWINRGAYDLMGVAPEATHSQAGMPRARALYGALPDHLRRSDSFANQLRHVLDVRRRFRIFESRQIDVPDVTAPGLLILVHELPDGLGIEFTALNFSAIPIEEVITVPGIAGQALSELLHDEGAGVVDAQGHFTVRLAGYEAKAYLAAG